MLVGMSGSRSYRQQCGLARALDVLGERWTMLVVRELAMGPRRYKDLLESLSGIGTNMLAARLKTLEAAHVIRPVLLPPPASARAYELTGYGEQLQSILSQLALWGYRLPLPVADNAEARASWALMAMAAMAKPEDVAALNATIEIRVDDEVMAVTADDTGARVSSGAEIGPDLTIDTDLQTFGALAEGRLSPSQSLKNKAVVVHGDRKLFTKFFNVFRIRQQSAA